MWIFVAQTLALASWQVACDSGDDDGEDDGADDEDDDGGDEDDGDDDDGEADDGAPMSTSASASGGEGGERVCGIIDPSISACDQCAADSCCAAAEACGADAECNSCFFDPPAPTVTAREAAAAVRAAATRAPR